MAFIPINPPSAGSACSVCYGTGKQFGNVVTPDYVSMIIAEIITGTAWQELDGLPANGSYKLVQISPCSWQNVSSDAIVTLIWTLAGTSVIVTRNGIDQFVSADSAACLVVGNNDFADSARNFSQGNYQLFL